MDVEKWLKLSIFVLVHTHVDILSAELVDESGIKTEVKIIGCEFIACAIDDVDIYMKWCYHESNMMISTYQLPSEGICKNK